VELHRNFVLKPFQRGWRTVSTCSLSKQLLCIYVACSNLHILIWHLCWWVFFVDKHLVSYHFFISRHAVQHCNVQYRWRLYSCRASDYNQEKMFNTELLRRSSLWKAGAPNHVCTILLLHLFWHVSCLDLYFHF